MGEVSLEKFGAGRGTELVGEVWDGGVALLQPGRKSPPHGQSKHLCAPPQKFWLVESMPANDGGSFELLVTGVKDKQKKHFIKEISRNMGRKRHMMFTAN